MVPHVTACFLGAAPAPDAIGGDGDVKAIRTKLEQIQTRRGVTASPSMAEPKACYPGLVAEAAASENRRSRVLGGAMRRHHDMGGEPAGPIERHEHDFAAWEKRVDAILRLLLANGLITLDELRRGVEELGPGAYDELSYFERWISSISNVLIEKGVLHVHEVGDAVAAAQRRHAEAKGS
jgi:hypothetical protein